MDSLGKFQRAGSLFVVFLLIAWLCLSSIVRASETASSLLIPNSFPNFLGVVQPIGRTVGDPVVPINCPVDCTATIYAEGSSSPDGLLLSPTGMLDAADEIARQTIKADSPQQGPAQGIILFIGDGMGEAHRTAARWSTVGQAGALAMDTMPVVGWSRTASADDPVTDSAASATAIATGQKTNNGVVAMDPGLNPLPTILEQAGAKGIAVGLVATTQMAHATPASFAAHVPDRQMMTEIARQMLATEVDVLLGGGEDEFLPTTDTGCYPQAGERTDDRNLITETVNAGYTYVCNATELAAVDPAASPRLLGLFADEGLDRPFSPTLAEMTQKAIDILSRDPDGFLLMVEGGQIDWAGHANDGSTVITDTVALDQAVAVAQTYAVTNPDTLIIVTADHETGGMSVGLTSSGLPGEDGPFFMPNGTPFYINWTSDYHTGANVPVTAQGPWSELLAGTYENTHLYTVMSLALDFHHQIWLPIIIRR